MRVEGNLIAIITCYGFELIRLVNDQLRHWKKIAFDWTEASPTRHYFFASWSICGERIIGAYALLTDDMPKAYHKAFKVETQTEETTIYAMEVKQLFVSSGFVNLLVVAILNCR